MVDVERLPRPRTELPRALEIAVYLVRDVGFPIAVAVYLLTRYDTLMRENTAALWSLHQAIERLLQSR